MMWLQLVLAATMVVGAGDDETAWRGFRGNGGDGLSEASGLPTSLGEKTQSWRVEIPAGYSSPIVVDDLLIVTAAEDTTLMTLALDRWSGEELWRAEIEYDGERIGANSAAAPSPASDGNNIFVVFHSIGLLAYSIDGEELWRHEIGPFNIPHGMSTSPILYDDLVILQVDQDLDAYLVAYDAETGDERWKTERPGATHGYATPTLHQPEEGPAEVILSGAFEISGYAAATGEKLWWVNGAAYMSKSVPAIEDGICFVSAYQPSTGEFGLPKTNLEWKELLGELDANADGKLAKEEWADDTVQMIWFIMDLDDDGFLNSEEWTFSRKTATETGALFAIRLGGRGDITDSHVEWRYDKRRGLPDCPSPLVINGTLYLLKEGSLLTAMDAKSGDVIKQERAGTPDRYFASPVAGDGMIYTASLGGQLGVIRAGKDWEVLSVEDLGEEIWSTPAIAGNQVFVRTQKSIVAFEEVRN